MPRTKNVLLTYMLFNEFNFFQKDSVHFCDRKFNLKDRILNFVTTRHSLQWFLVYLVHVSCESFHLLSSFISLVLQWKSFGCFGQNVNFVSIPKNLTTHIAITQVLTHRSLRLQPKGHCFPSSVISWPTSVSQQSTIQ